MYRVKVVSAFLRAGVPLHKIESFREILEENAHRLTDRRHMYDYVPFILKQEEDCIRTEINGKDVSVIFDGTSRHGEALAIILRFADDEWIVQQRLVRVQMLSKSLTGEEIARELINVLSVTYHIRSGNLLATMRDRASSNGVAIRTIKVVYPGIVDVGCFSHTLDHVGGHFNTPILSEFVSMWINLFSHSPKTKLLWKSATGYSMASYSSTRWWSKWEVIKQLMLFFGDIESFLSSNSDIAPSLRPKLLTMLSDPLTKAKLQMEMAATVDWGEPFVQACYCLEGDGVLALECYEVIDKVILSINTEHIPNVLAVARKLSGQSSGESGQQQTSPLYEQWVAYARHCIKGGLEYFNHQLTTSMKESLAVFKACRLFIPQKVREMKPTASFIDESLSVVPFLDTNEREKLKIELPAYLARVADIDNDINPLEWWKRNSTTLPYFSSTAKKVVLVQPSSAASERVFSMLRATFDEQQDSTLQDYIEASLMMQFNKR